MVRTTIEDGSNPVSNVSREFNYDDDYDDEAQIAYAKKTKDRSYAAVAAARCGGSKRAVRILMQPSRRQP